MGRLDMADYLGLTIETVSRVITSLARRELIAVSGRHAMVLRKLSALRRVSGDENSLDASSAPAGSRRAVWPH
jgi:CRP/FNR family transcriptional regulator